jgi:hypothetical protein
MIDKPDLVVEQIRALLFELRAANQSLPKPGRSGAKA